MRDTFLIGSFLKGYSAVFAYARSRKPAKKAFTVERLAARFRLRSERFHSHRVRRVLYLQLGLATALVCTTLAFRLPVHVSSSFEVVEVRQELVAMEEVQQTRQQLLPPPPPRPPVPVEVPDDVVLDDMELDLDAALDLDAEIMVLEPPPAAEEPEVYDEPEVFVAVEEMPELIGGYASLMKSVVYPVVARRAGVEGTVVIQLVVGTDGVPRDAFVARSVAPALDEVALEAVMKQRFTPGRQRGRPVLVQIAIPVIFKLSR